MNGSIFINYYYWWRYRVHCSSFIRPRSIKGLSALMWGTVVAYSSRLKTKTIVAIWLYESISRITLNGLTGKSVCDQKLRKKIKMNCYLRNWLAGIIVCAGLVDFIKFLGWSLQMWFINDLYKKYVDRDVGYKLQIISRVACHTDLWCSLQFPLVSKSYLKIYSLFIKHCMASTSIVIISDIVNFDFAS